MFRYADPLACPSCRGPISDAWCPRCSLRLDVPLGAEVFGLLQQVDTKVGQLRSLAYAASPAAPPVTPVRTVAPPAAATTRISGGHEPHLGMSGVSVPKILLGLGALCLIVAGLVFLAVAWSSLGIGGRTAVLVGFTLTAGALSAWSARMGLAAGAEALGAVALALLGLDVAGARTAGWLGGISDGTFGIVLGGVLAVAGTAATLASRRTKLGRLVTGELAAALGIATAVVSLGLLDGVEPAPWAALALGVAGAAAYGFHRLALPFATAVTAAQAAAAWLALAALGLVRCAEQPDWSALWGDLRIWPLLLATAVLATGALLPIDRTVRVGAAAAAAVLATIGVVAPLLDEGGTVPEWTGVGVIAVAAAAATALHGRSWSPVPLPTLALAGLALAAPTLPAAALAAAPLTVHGVWDRHAGDALVDVGPDGWVVLLPVAVAAVLAAGVVLARSAGIALRRTVPAAAAVALGAAALSTVVAGAPLAVVTAALLATCATGTAVSLRLRDLPAGAVAVAAYVMALAGGLADDGTTITVLALGTAAVVALELRGPAAVVGAARTVQPVLGGALLWSVLAVAGTPMEWRALPLVAGAGLLALARPRATTEAPAWTAAAIALAAAGTDQMGATRLAVHLTVAGVLVAASSLLHPHRRQARWVALALFVLAQWLRLADLGVETVEAYTLPLALLLLAVGTRELVTGDGDSFRTQGAGLGLALVPSLLQALVDEPGTRTVLLGAGCIVLIAVGLRMRWAAPLLAGTGVLALVALRQAVEAQVLPQWALLALAGVTLTIVGLTWERRLADLRRAAAYVRALR